MEAPWLLPVQISPRLWPLGGQHAPGIHGEGESIARAPRTVPSSSFFATYFLNGCQRDAESSCRLFGPQEQCLTALAPSSILCSYLGSAAACSSFCRDALPTMHLFFNLSLSPSLPVLCLCLSLSLYTHFNCTEGEKPFSFLPSLI